MGSVCLRVKQSAVNATRSRDLQDNLTRVRQRWVECKGQLRRGASCGYGVDGMMIQI